ncbi:MAG: WXG100 family type VII secretion target, partial [Anaerolineales bacterium]
DQLQSFIKAFQSEAEEYQALSKETNNKVEELHNGGWVGRGSDAFFEEMHNEILPAVQRLVRALQQAGQITREIAEIFNNAEEESQSFFRSLAE